MNNKIINIGRVRQNMNKKTERPPNSENYIIERLKELTGLDTKEIIKAINDLKNKTIIEKLKSKSKLWKFNLQ